MKNIVIILVCLALSGCAGIGVLAPSTWQESVTMHDGPGAPVRTKASVASSIRHEGQRPRIIVNGESETWLYKDANDWCGALIVVVPLMVPACENSDTYEFSGDELVRHEVKAARFSGVMCSIFPVCPDGGSCKLCLSE